MDKEKIVHDEDMSFSLKFKWEEDGIDKPFWVNFEGVEIAAYREGEENDPEYDMGGGDNEGKTFEEAYKQNPLLHGHIKWDGCMEIHNFNHHWCQRDTFAQRIVDMIYKEAASIIGDRFEA